MSSSLPHFTADMILELEQNESIHRGHICLYMWLVLKFGYNKEFVYKDFLDKWTCHPFTTRRYIRELTDLGLIKAGWSGDYGYAKSVRTFKIP